MPRLSSPPPWMRERLGQGKPVSPSVVSSAAQSAAGHSSSANTTATAKDTDSGVVLDTSSATADSGSRTSGTQSTIETEFPAENGSPRMKHVGLLQQRHFQLASQLAAGMPKSALVGSPQLSSSGSRTLAMGLGKVGDKSSGSFLPSAYNKDDVLCSTLSKRPVSLMCSLTSMMSLNDLLDRGANKSGGCDDTFSMIDVNIDVDSHEDCADASDVESHDQTENSSACCSKHLECEDTEHSTDVTVREDDDGAGDKLDDEVFLSRERGLIRPRSTSDVGGGLKLASSVSECQRLGCDDPALKALLATARSQRTRSDDNLLRTTVRNSSKQPRSDKSGSELRKFFAKVRLSFHSKSPPKAESSEKDSEKHPNRKQKFHLFRRSSSMRKSKTSIAMQGKSGTAIDTPVTANRKNLASTSIEVGGDRSCSNLATPAKFSGDNVIRAATASLATARKNLQCQERPVQVVAAAESLEHVVPCDSDRSFCSGTLTPESVADARQRSLSCSLPMPVPLRQTMMRLSVSTADLDRFSSKRQTTPQQAVRSLLAFHARLQNWWQCSRVSNKAPREHSIHLCSPDILNDTPDVVSFIDALY